MDQSIHKPKSILDLKKFEKQQRVSAMKTSGDGWLNNETIGQRFFSQVESYLHFSVWHKSWCTICRCISSAFAVNSATCCLSCMIGSYYSYRVVLESFSSSKNEDAGITWACINVGRRWYFVRKRSWDPSQVRLLHRITSVKNITFQLSTKVYTNSQRKEKAIVESVTDPARDVNKE